MNNNAVQKDKIIEPAKKINAILFGKVPIPNLIR